MLFSSLPLSFADAAGTLKPATIGRHSILTCSNLTKVTLSLIIPTNFYLLQVFFQQLWLCRDCSNKWLNGFGRFWTEKPAYRKPPFDFFSAFSIAWETGDVELFEGEYKLHCTRSDKKFVSTVIQSSNFSR